MRNDILLTYENDGVVQKSHFKLREFESDSGLVVIDPGLLRSLELVRRDLGRFYSRTVEIVITSGTRTLEENETLGARLGWTDQGGLVARDSMHLPHHGGIAVDLYARYREGNAWVVVPQAVTAQHCKMHFRFVKADYTDGHVHADNRNE
jgi:hypothetical protein